MNCISLFLKWCFNFKRDCQTTLDRCLEIMPGGGSLKDYKITTLQVWGECLDFCCNKLASYERPVMLLLPKPLSLMTRNSKQWFVLCREYPGHRATRLFFYCKCMWAQEAQMSLMIAIPVNREKRLKILAVVQGPCFFLLVQAVQASASGTFSVLLSTSPILWIWADLTLYFH